MSETQTILDNLFRQFCEDQGLDYDDYDSEDTSNGLSFSSGNEEYRLLDECEAEDLFNETLDNYIDDCILSQIPQNLRYYFDSEAFKRDVQLNEGRGPTLAPYDGIEHEYFFRDPSDRFVSVYIYRIN